MSLPETKQAILLEIHSWENIISSQEWVVFRNLLKQHEKFLQDEVNSHVAKHEDREAGEALRALKDCQKILGLVTDRLNKLRAKVGG